MKRLLLLLTLTLACNLLHAQGDTKQPQTFSEINVKYGEAKINFQTHTIEEMAKGVEVTFGSEDVAAESMVITADTMTVLNEEGSSGISGFVMHKGKGPKDKVKFKYQEINITADKLEWSTSTGSLRFSGNVVAEAGNDNLIRAEAIIYDLATGSATIIEGSNKLSLEE